MPENEDLKWHTHNNIRKTLFFSVFRTIKYVEYKRLKSEEDFFELQKIEPWEESLIDRWLDKYYSKDSTGKLLDVQKWTMKRVI